jgi:hypothetical protein
MKDVTQYLPIYPQACSALVLAIGSGILRKPYTDRRAAKAVRKVMRCLDKATLDGVPVLERRMPITPSTKKKLEAEGFSGPFPGTAAYFSIRN